MIRNISGYKCDLTDSNTKIYDSYKLRNDAQITCLVVMIIRTRRALNLKITRDTKCYVREIKAHNKLYKMGLFKSHTKDTDLEEPISKNKRLIFNVIGM